MKNYSEGVGLNLMCVVLPERKHEDQSGRRIGRDYKKEYPLL